MSNYIGISALGYFVGSEHADTFHFYCYHGSERNGIIYASQQSDRFVTQPGFPLLMSKEALEAITPLCKGMEHKLIETEYHTFDMPFKIGSFAHWDDPSYPGDDGDCLIEYLVSKAVKGSKIKYAFILPELEQTDVATESTVQLHMGPTEWDPPIILKAKPQKEITAFSVGHSHFLPQFLFDALRPYLIDELYTIRTFEL